MVSGPGRPSPLGGTVLRLGRPTPHRGPRLSGRSEGVALHPGPSTTGGMQKIGPPVYWTFSHPEGHKSGGSQTPAPALYAHPPHIPCLQGQTFSRKSPGTCNSASPTPSPPRRWAGLHHPTPVAISPLRKGVTILGGLGGLRTRRKTVGSCPTCPGPGTHCRIPPASPRPAYKALCRQKGSSPKTHPCPPF